MDRKITWSSVVGLITTTVALLVAFNVPISEDQQNAIVGVAVALGPIAMALTGYFTHSSVADTSVPIEMVRADRGPSQ